MQPSRAKRGGSKLTFFSLETKSTDSRQWLEQLLPTVAELCESTISNKRKAELLYYDRQNQLTPLSQVYQFNTQKMSDLFRDPSQNGMVKRLS